MRRRKIGWALKATNYGLTSEREEKGSRSDFARNKRYRNNARRASAIHVRERERDMRGTEIQGLEARNANIDFRMK